MKKIAFYGKGGIGKSTTVSNLASALARQGYRVFQIGCDPKADSTVNHNGGERIPTILDVVRQGGGDDERDFLRISPSGVYCMEAGGPLPGTGCAGRGIIAAFEKLDELDVYENTGRISCCTTCWATSCAGDSPCRCAAAMRTNCIS